MELRYPSGSSAGTRSGGGLDPDEEIPFAIAVTLQVAATAQYDVHEEIRDQLLVRLRGDGLA